jgi:Tol biopolymer transport system component
MNSDGTHVVKLTIHSCLESSPVWSPDGRQITFTSGRDGNAEICLMDADGSHAICLTQNTDMNLLETGSRSNV